MQASLSRCLLACGLVNSSGHANANTHAHRQKISRALSSRSVPGPCQTPPDSSPSLLPFISTAPGLSPHRSIDLHTLINSILALCLLVCLVYTHPPVIVITIIPACAVCALPQLLPPPPSPSPSGIIVIITSLATPPPVRKDHQPPGPLSAPGSSLKTAAAAAAPSTNVPTCRQALSPKGPHGHYFQESLLSASAVSSASLGPTLRASRSLAPSLPLPTLPPSQGSRPSAAPPRPRPCSC